MLIDESGMKKSSRMAVWIVGFCVAALTGILAGCDFSAEMKLSGKTMGTTWHVTLMADPWTRKTAIREVIETELAAVNQSMSVHIPDSEISRFNSHNAIQEPFEISERFQDVIRVSRTVFELTDGAWDGTIFPLIRLWGFNTGTPVHIPDPADIQALLKNVGFRHLRFPDARHIRKMQIPLMLDLSSIAKGYGVDRVAAVLRSRDIHRFLVEIGGQQFSHVFDPRTGYPVSNGVVSVSVTADTCTLADGLATGLMVMGPEEGMDRIRRMTGVECLMVVRKTDGSLTQFVSDGFNTVP